MRQIRVFSSQPLKDSCELQLDSPAAHHVAQVLRLQEGDSVVLFDGSGREFPGSISAVRRSDVRVSIGIGQWVSRESPLQIELWHGLCRSERMDTVIQKAVELGVHALRPVITAHSGRALPSGHIAKKLEHWKRIAISACQQCGRNRVPDIHAPQTLSVALDCIPECDAALLLDPAGETGFAPAISGATRLVVLAGPEGGLSADETATAVAAGFRPVRLGPRVLRTETAPLAALAILQHMAGDLR